LIKRFLKKYQVENIKKGPGQKSVKKMSEPGFPGLKDYRD
jgi:hypothetical protein